MKRIAFLFSCLFLFGTLVGAQEKATSKPQKGRYIQTGTKETMVVLCHASGPWPVKIQVVSVDVLDDKKMRLNFIISNTKDRSCRVTPSRIKDRPIYIVDENLTKYKPLGKLKAGWNPYKKNEHILGPTEKTKGSIIFPLLVEGATKFDFYFGYDAQPIKNIELIK